MKLRGKPSRPPRTPGKHWPACSAVVSGCVRRVWVTVLVGLLGLVVGLTIGFTVGLSRREVDPAWLEAVGTWFGAGVTLIAVILAAIVFFSEEFTRRREHRRQQAADEQAEKTKQDMLQREADLVFCDAAPAVPGAVGMMVFKGGTGKTVTLDFSVHNRSSHLITGLVCSVAGIDRRIFIREALGPEEPPARQMIQATMPFEVNTDIGELRRSTQFEFALDGVAWSKRYGEPAQRVP